MKTDLGHICCNCREIRIATIPDGESMYGRKCKKCNGKAYFGGCKLQVPRKTNKNRWKAIRLILESEPTAFNGSYRACRCRRCRSAKRSGLPRTVGGAKRYALNRKQLGFK